MVCRCNVRRLGKVLIRGPGLLVVFTRGKVLIDPEARC